ncbi:hypothetical protein P9112_000434 [Eukaryota sp. TZLM1-RC]
MECSSCHHTFRLPNSIIPHVECLSCSFKFCLTHFPALKQSLQDLDTMYKVSSIHDDTSNIEVMSRNDDEESFRLTHFCPVCMKETLFHPHFLQCSSNKCTRCLDFYDPASMCHTHCGVHELPVDRDGKFTFGVALIDSGGQCSIANAYPLLLHGRWSCCGVLCLHRFSNCPVHSSMLPSHSFPPSLAPDEGAQLELGCVSVQHTSNPNPHPKFGQKVAIPCTQCCIDWGSWGEAKVDPNDCRFREGVNWNINEPYKWNVSGDLVCEDVKLFYKSNIWIG